MDNPVINGLLVFVIGMVVVFLGMTLIVVIVSICGKVMSKANGVEKKPEEPVQEQPVAEIQPAHEEIPEPVKVAIIAAISAYYFNSQSKCDFVVRKIKRF